MKNIKIYLIICIIFSLIVTYKYFNLFNLNKELTKETLKQNTMIDSLKSELFMNEIELNRYEMTLGKVKEKDSICGFIFEKTMETETE